MPKSLGPYLEITSFAIGPDTGDSPTSPDTWERIFAPDPPLDEIRFVLLNFSAVSLPADNKLEVDLGYDTDTFDSSSGTPSSSTPSASVGGCRFT